MLNYGLAAAAVSMLLIAVDGVIAKYMLRRFSLKAYVPMVLVIGLIPMLAVQYLYGGNYNLQQYLPEIILGSAFLAAGYIFYYKALSQAEVSKVTIFSNIQPLIIFTFGLFFLGEGISAIPLLGAVLIFIGSSLGIYEKGIRIDRKLVPAVFANASWGIYWIFMSSAVNVGNYITPLLAARAIAFIAVMLFYMGQEKGNTASAKAKTHAKNNKNRHIGAIALTLLIIGLFIASFVDSGINIFFSLAISLSFAVLGSAIIAFAPMITAVIGKVAFNDRLRAHQLLGLIIAVIGAVLIAITA